MPLRRLVGSNSMLYALATPMSSPPSLCDQGARDDKDEALATGTQVAAG